jgi:hypothetical protein
MNSVKIENLNFHAWLGVAWCGVVRVCTCESKLRVIPAAYTKSGDVHPLRLRGKMKKIKKSSV